MVRYTNIPERQRWVFGYYLFLCLAGFSIVLGSPGPAIPIALGDSLDRESCLSSPGMGGGEITNCGNGPCHPAEYSAWSTTGHATHIVEINATHVLIGNTINVSYSTFDAECAPCHTSDYNNVTGNYDDIGVDCRACHDASWPEYSDYSEALCVSCHNGNAPSELHPSMVTQNSAHADSLSDLRSSPHASSACMYCHSTESFIYFRNPDLISVMSPAVNTSFPVDGLYNEISCPACHAVHANWSSSPAMIRAENDTALCGICHSGPEQPMFDLWIGSSHHLAGVECTDCHGYDVPVSGSAFMNHSFEVDPQTVCGQSEFCHQDMETYILGQLQVIQDTYSALTLEILTLASSLEFQVDEYSAVTDANATVIAIASTAIDDARCTVQSFERDKSNGVHDWRQTYDSLNTVHRALLYARAAIFEAESIVHDLISGELDITTYTITVTRFVDPPPPLPGQAKLNFVGGTVVGLLASIVVGIIVGRKHFYD